MSHHEALWDFVLGCDLGERKNKTMKENDGGKGDVRCAERETGRRTNGKRRRRFNLQGVMYSLENHLYNMHSHALAACYQYCFSQ